ncbi:Sugar kinase of the NBD/HSP70 family, may contain an N-terminal HTH domain [Streptomyces sp. yr375]|uniref:ROK family transcriptional regulator n=1 Tax=Streptomyces sp. yr375 TaxID=1761906 RepID=UPI0008BD8D5E|nr:ROK family transcriptional regulator [Streptomyces sp. yr375]SER66120.1 Sugar kinase of the NBD/HSP70 family, may contain an N-terminal HTH domain [Streptomyces sp. yr375]
MEIRREFGGSALPSMALLRELTDQIVLDTVFEQAPITRAEIAQRTGISKTTVSESVRRLERMKLLLPAGEQRGRQGRVGTYYQVAADAGFVVAVDLHPTEIRLCAADLFGRAFLETTHQPVPPRNPDHIARQVRALVAGAIEEGSVGHGRPLAIGVSVANPVDPRTSAVIPLADTPYPEGVFQPQEALAGLTDAPLLVENDVNLAAVAERRHGAAREAESVAYVFIGAGMGMGLVVGDRLVRGARGVAGEIGYLSVGSQPPETGDDVGIGSGIGVRHGFARAVAAAGFGSRRHNTKADGAGRADGADGVDGADTADSADAVVVAREIFRLAAEGDVEALAVIEREGRTIGEAIATVCAVVDPELVLLGGPIGSHPALLDVVRETVNRLAPLPPPVEAGALGEAAPLRGALTVALRRARSDLRADAGGE